MSIIKFKYNFECFNCSTMFSFEHKSDSVESAICPVCRQDRQIPKDITKIEQVSKENDNNFMQINQVN